MPKTRTIYWKTGSRRYTKGLEAACNPRKNGGSKETHVTIRKGPDWAIKANPGEILTITVIGGKKIKTLGPIEVVTAKKSTIPRLTDEDLKKNIGAKNRRAVHYDMQKLYKERIDINTKVVSVLEWRVVT